MRARFGLSRHSHLQVSCTTFLGEKRAGDACVTPEGRQGTLEVRRDDLPFVVPTRLDEAHLPIPRAAVLECEELRPPFAPACCSTYGR